MLCDREFHSRITSMVLSSHHFVILLQAPTKLDVILIYGQQASYI